MTQMDPTEAANANIVLADGDTPAAEALRDALQARNYCVWPAATAAEAETLVAEAHPDLIVLEIMLPDLSGLVLLANLKARLPEHVPIIVCSGTRRRDDGVLALKLGADDFVAKPVDLVEFEARVEAALRRNAAGAFARPPAPGMAQVRQRAGQLVIDHPRCRVTLGGDEVRLTPTEYRLLCALVDRQGDVVSRQALAQHAWGTYDAGIDRALEVHMRRLRHKLSAAAAASGPADSAPEIVTMRGFGYRLVAKPDAESQLLAQAGAP